MEDEQAPDYGEADCRKGYRRMKLIRIVTLSVLLSFCYGDNLFAELTRSDIKEEIQHVDKRIDDLKTEVQGIRSEIAGIRTEIKAEQDIMSEINAVRSDLRGLIKTYVRICRVFYCGVSGLYLLASLRS